MKKFFILLIFPLLFAACGNQAEEDRLQAQIDSLKAITDTDEGTISEFVQSFNEIQANLDLIKQKENIISVKTSGDVELDASAKDEINSDIQAIYDLMAKNKKQLAYMSKKLRDSNSQSSELKKMVETLTVQIAERDAELANMQNHLEKLNIDIENLNDQVENLETNLDSLGVENADQQETISEQDQALNTVYYVYGSKKELKAQKVITSEGGFIGIGRMEKLMENFNTEYFQTIDLRKTKSISLFCKKAEIVTSHPSGTYHFSGDDKVDNLVITDPVKFWSVSKYLVIIID